MQQRSVKLYRMETKTDMVLLCVEGAFGLLLLYYILEEGVEMCVTPSQCRLRRTVSSRGELSFGSADPQPPPFSPLMAQTNGTRGLDR